MIPTILSILMLAGIALLAGGLHMLVRRRDIKRGALMLVAAAVMFGNVVIWLAPTPGGQSLGNPSLNDQSQVGAAQNTTP